MTLSVSGDYTRTTTIRGAQNITNPQRTHQYELFAGKVITTENEVSFSGLVAENLQELEETTPLTPEQQIEKEKKVEAYKKLDSTMEKMSNVEFVLSPKHNDALRLINENPELAHLGIGLMGKINGAFDQQLYFLNKLELASVAQITADEINSVIKSVDKAFKQLQQDFAKITSGVLRAGAYSEAMMIVDDNEKQAEYKRNAEKIISDLPEPLRNKENAADVEIALENAYADTEIDKTNANDDINETEELTDSIDALDEVGEFDENNLNDQALGLGKYEEDVEVEDDFDIFSPSQQSIDDNDELQELKKDVEFHLKRQQEDDKLGNETADVFSSQGIKMNSILFR